MVGFLLRLADWSGDVGGKVGLLSRLILWRVRRLGVRRFNR